MPALPSKSHLVKRKTIIPLLLLRFWLVVFDVKERHMVDGDYPTVSLASLSMAVIRIARGRDGLWNTTANQT